MKHLLLWIALFAVSLGASAQVTEKDAMVVETKGGEKVFFFFDDKPEVTFSGENAVIATSSDKIEYPMSGIARVYFGKGTSTAIDKTTTGKVGFYVSGDELRAEGLTPGQ